MQSWNLGNCENDCKDVLECALRPKYLRVIPTWIANASAKDKQQVQWLGRQIQRGKSNNRAPKHLMKNQPMTENGFGYTTYDREKNKTLDYSIRQHNDFRKKKYNLANKKPGNTSTTFKAGKQAADYFLLDSRHLRNEPGSKLLLAKSLGDLESWQMSNIRPLDEKANLVKTLQTIDSTFKSLPRSRSQTALMSELSVHDRLYAMSKDDMVKHVSPWRFEASLHPPPIRKMVRPCVAPDQSAKHEKTKSSVYFPGGGSWQSSYNSFFQNVDGAAKIYSSERSQSAPHFDTIMTPREYEVLRG